MEARARVLPGMALGLRQPALFCTIQACPPPGLDLAALDRALGEIVANTSTSPGAYWHDENSGIALIARLHHWHGLVQRDMSIPVFGDCGIVTLGGEPIARYLMAVPYAQPQATKAALRWVLGAINALAAHSGGAVPDSLRQGLDALREELRPMALRSTNAIHFLTAANRLDMQITPLTENIFALGQGANNRWLNSSITDRTPSVGVGIARNKYDAARVLGSFGLPMPRHEIARTESQAVTIAGKLGYPVVIKPHDQDQGRGVFAGLKTEASVRKAYKAAREFSPNILVETHYFGEDYRFTVVHDRVVKIMHRRPGGVAGDGVKTIAGLLADVQQTAEHQRALRRTGKMRLELDDEAMELMEEQGLTASSVPPAGHFVTLRRKNNISSGGSYVTLTAADAHPDNCALAVRAARTLSLDLAGIDLIMPDLAKPWHETGAVICEINAQPQIGFRDTPDIYVDILREMIDGDGGIPCHLLVVENAELPALLGKFQQIARNSGCNALATSAGAWIDGEQFLWQPENGFAAARALLLDRQVQGLLFAMSPRDILNFGLPSVRLATARVLGYQRDRRQEAALRQALRFIRPHVQRIIVQSMKGPAATIANPEILP